MEKIKSFFNETLQSQKGKDILTVIIVILVGLGSFELGRLSKESASEGIKIEYPSQSLQQSTDQTANVISAVSNPIDVGRLDSGRPTSAKTFFASSKGKKYYTISCSAGKTIKQENRVYFKTGEEAEQSGYTLSGSCN